jgi:hypothetical protein
MPDDREQRVLVAFDADVGSAYAAVEGSQGPVTLVLEGQPRVIGTVSAAGGGVPDALVQVYGEGRATPVAQAHTDERGAYATVRLPPGGYRVFSPGNPEHGSSRAVDVTLPAGAGEHRVDLTVEALPRLTLLLLDADRAPWSDERIRRALGVDVAAVEFFFSRREHAVRTELELDSMPASPLAFDAATGTVRGVVRDPAAKVLSAWQGARRLAAATLPEWRAQAEAVVPLRAARLEVEVEVTYEPEPSELPEVAVSLVVVHGDGGSEVLGEARERGKRVVVHGDAAGAALVVARAAGWTARAVRVDLAAGAPRQHAAVALRPATRTLGGVVLDPGGVPIAGAVVAAVPEQGELPVPEAKRAVTNAAGEFRLEGLDAGALRLYGMAPGLASTSVHVGAEATSARLELQRGRRIEVRDAERGVHLRTYDVAGAMLSDDRALGVLRHGAALSFVVDARAASIDAVTARGRVVSGPLPVTDCVDLR